MFITRLHTDLCFWTSKLLLKYLPWKYFGIYVVRVLLFGFIPSGPQSCWETMKRKKNKLMLLVDKMSIIEGWPMQPLPEPGMWDLCDCISHCLCDALSVSEIFISLLSMVHWCSWSPILLSRVCKAHFLENTSCQDQEETNTARIVPCCKRTVKANFHNLISKYFT